jgi:2-haloacid dehalogenase
MADREVLVFDLYGTLVDPIAISSELARLLAPADGLDVARLWRSRQVEYSFRLTVMGRYQDFRWVTTRALDDTLAALDIELSEAKKAELVALYDRLEAFPDTMEGLQMLRRAGHVLAVLSNGSPNMVENCLKNSGLRELFAAVVSVDDVRAFKPSPVVYQYAATKLGCSIGESRLISSNPFDVIGAKTAGMRTAWLNRSGARFDTLGEPPDITVSSLTQLRDRLSALD